LRASANQINLLGSDRGALRVPEESKQKKYELNSLEK
jgi:hypothetical protein